MTAGTSSRLVTPWRATESRIAAGSTSRSTTTAPPCHSPARAQPEPAMWNSGITASVTASASIRHGPATPAHLQR